jgi:hypothetical protein
MTAASVALAAVVQVLATGRLVSPGRQIPEVVVVVQADRVLRISLQPQAAPASSSCVTQDLLALLGVQFRKQGDTPFTPSQPAAHLRSSR